ncbi:Right handed beta helix region, partial [Candidatus Methanophagaceae archaeon]
TANSNNNYGIRLYDSSNNTLTSNTVKLNYDGIYIENADDNNITCNWVHGNTHAGFNLTGGSTGNNISCNNIVANGVPNGTAWEWQFFNNQTQAVEAKNNYWGAGMDNTTIEASIKENTGNVTYNPFEGNPNICAPIPELSTVILLGIGLLMLAGYLRIRRKR